jgi:hypothetical protein
LFSRIRFREQRVPSLFSRHPLPLQTAYSDLKRQAREQPFLLVGTPGTVSVREVRGAEFYYRQFYDAEGAKAAEYIGSVAATDGRAASVREQVATAKELAKTARLLAREGYVAIEPRANAILVALANGGLFRGGAVLVGSHAYGVVLNELGVRAAAFTTEDIDIARGEPLAIADGTDFAKVLAGSTLTLHPVPGLGPRAPSTSYKPPGRDRLRVDLLVPAPGKEITTRAVPELNAHAQALPYLAYLIADPIDAVVVGKESVVPVRVPRPEALAWHKALTSQLRSSTTDKRNKDLAQAAVLFSVLAEDAPDALADALARIPRSAKRTAVAGARAAVARMDRESRAAAELRDMVA